jgi:signal transduction histidine kinase
MMAEDRAGLGLGLAIVDAISRAHGGSCALQPSAQGSTFAMRLPGFRAAGERAPAPS